MAKKNYDLTSIAIPKKERPRLDLLAVVLMDEKGVPRIPNLQDTVVMAIGECLERRGYTIDTQREPGDAIKTLLAKHPLAQ